MVSSSKAFFHVSGNQGWLWRINFSSAIQNTTTYWKLQMKYWIHLLNFLLNLRKSTIKAPERHYWRRSFVFIVNFEQISLIVSVVSIVDFEQLNAGWVCSLFITSSSPKRDLDINFLGFYCFELKQIEFLKELFQYVCTWCGFFFLQYLPQI